MVARGANVSGAEDTLSPRTTVDICNKGELLSLVTGPIRTLNKSLVVLQELRARECILDPPIPTLNFMSSAFSIYVDS